LPRAEHDGQGLRDLYARLQRRRRNHNIAVNYISAQTSFPATYPSFIGRFDQAFGQKNKLNVIGFRSGLTQSYPMQGFPKGIGPTTSTSGYGLQRFPQQPRRQRGRHTTVL